MDSPQEESSEVRNKVERFFAVIGVGAGGKWIVYGVVIGLLSGTIAWLFFASLQWSSFLVLGKLAGAPPLEPHGEKIIHMGGDTSFRRWLFFLLPAVGGLISGIIIQLWAPEAEGEGTDALVDTFHNKKALVRARIPFLKGLSTLAVLATGGSAGREGPIAQMGGGVGSWLAQKLGLTVQERRTMLLMGTGGGLGAIFRAPLGGAVTALEVFYREDLEAGALLPTVISSVIAYALFSTIFGYDHIFAMPPFKFQDVRELFFYLILGLLITPVGIFYVKFFYATRNFFRRLKLPKFAKPALGGLLVGLIGLLFPGVYGSGWGQIQQAILGEVGSEFLYALYFLLGLMFFKILATSFTIGSGGSGGVFGPTLFIGGMLGGAVGLAANHFYPEIVTQPGAYVVVGMAGFFSAVGKAPIGATLMIMEMTGGYGLLAPLLLVGSLGIIFTRRWSIFEKQVENRLKSPAHAGDFVVNILKELNVSDVFERAQDLLLVPEDMPFAQLKELIANTIHNTFPVVDKNGNLKGILSLKTARTALFQDEIDDLVVAGDICQEAVPVSPNETLYDALMKFVEADLGQLPVVDAENPHQVLGFLTHENLLEAYRNEITRRKLGG